MEFNRENLIPFISQYPIIWDLSHKDHYNVNKKNEVLDEIASQFAGGITRKEVFAKWRSLMTYYGTCLRTQRAKRSSGSAPARPKWPLFNSIDAFLGSATTNFSNESNSSHIPSSECANRPENMDFCEYSDEPKVMVEEKQNEIDEEISLFLNSLRPSLRKLYADEERYEDTKFAITDLIHKQVKETLRNSWNF